MEFDQYDMVAKKIVRLKDVLFRMFCITLAFGLVFFAYQLIAQVRIFQNLNVAILQEYASRENLQQSMLARSRLHGKRIEEVMALTGGVHGSSD